MVEEEKGGELRRKEGRTRRERRREGLEDKRKFCKGEELKGNKRERER